MKILGEFHFAHLKHWYHDVDTVLVRFQQSCEDFEIVHVSPTSSWLVPMPSRILSGTWSIKKFDAMSFEFGIEDWTVGVEHCFLICLLKDMNDLNGVPQFLQVKADIGIRWF